MMFDLGDAHAIEGNNIEDILPFIIKNWEEKWITGYDYKRATPEVFNGAAFPFDPLDRAELIRCFLYVEKIFAESYEGDPHTLPELARQEVARSERAGGLCIYLSVLLHCLLMESKIAGPEEIRLVQGYHSHELRKDFPFEWGKWHSGLHSWLVWGDIVLDVSIRQEEQFFDFKGRPYILGKVPDGLDLVGFREPKKTPMKYARRYAKESGLQLDAWIRQHVMASCDVALDRIREMEESA